MKTYKARGIVLNTVKYGDTSMIVHMLTDLYGRQSYMVQGVRSTRGHGSKAALFQPMFALEFEGLVSTRMELHRFREVRNAIVMQSLPFEVRKSTIALFMAEVLYRLVRESEPNEALFEFVWNSVGALDAMEDGTANFHLWFMANMSRFLGFSPGNIYTKGDWFDCREGLYTPFEPLHGQRMTPGNAEILRDLLECDVRLLAEIGLSRRQRVEFLDAVTAYFGYHLDAVHNIGSIRIFQEMFR